MPRRCHLHPPKLQARQSFRRPLRRHPHHQQPLQYHPLLPLRPQVLLRRGLLGSRSCLRCHRPHRRFRHLQCLPRSHLSRSLRLRRFRFGRLLALLRRRLRCRRPRLRSLRLCLPPKSWSRPSASTRTVSPGFNPRTETTSRYTCSRDRRPKWPSLEPTSSSHTSSPTGCQSPTGPTAPRPTYSPTLGTGWTPLCTGPTRFHWASFSCALPRMESSQHSTT